MQSIKKHIPAIFITGLLIAILVFQAYESEKIVNEKDTRINELEREVWSLKTDSLIQSHTTEFKKKLDSMYAARFASPSP